MKSLSPIAKAFIALVVLSAAAVVVQALLRVEPARPGEFLGLLLVSLVASRLRVKLPGVTGTMSVNLPFILFAAARMNPAQALAIGCLSTLVQSLPRAPKKFNWVHALFNFSNMALAVSATRLLYNSAVLGSAIQSRSLLLAVAAGGFFAVNSIPVAIVISLTEGKNPLRAWAVMFQLSYPYFLTSAAVAALMVVSSGKFGWQIPVLVLPLMIGIFYSYRRYFSAGQTQPETQRAALPGRATAAAS